MSQDKEFIEDTITVINIPDVANSLLLRWETLGVNPTRSSVILKLAHIHLETGLKSCHCYNLGNIKSHPQDQYAYTMFACGEEVLESIAEQMVAKDSQHVIIKSRYIRNNKQMASIWVTPPHDWTKFAAFHNLNEGIMAQLTYLKRHSSVLNALITGNAFIYSSALAKENYFTADPNLYTNVLNQRIKIVKKDLEHFDWGDVPEMNN